MIPTTNVQNGYQYGANSGRLFNGGLANAFSTVATSMSGVSTGVVNSFMTGLTGIVDASANVVGSISPEVAQAVTGAIGASQGIPNVGNLLQTNPKNKLFDDTTVNNDTKSSKYMVIGAVVLGIALLLGIFAMFKTKGGTK